MKRQACGLPELSGFHPHFESALPLRGQQFDIKELLDLEDAGQPAGPTAPEIFGLFVCATIQ
ncbi:MAG: hypothetical protein ACREAM_03170, partial [Blastocatellia bacterium]